VDTASFHRNLRIDRNGSRENEKAARSIMTGRPSRNKGDAEASPADRLLADHTRELEEEERSSGLYRSEAGHPEGGGEQMTNYSRNCSLLNRRTFVRVR
jgi:hypothetical protein